MVGCCQQSGHFFVCSSLKTVNKVEYLMSKSWKLAMLDSPPLCVSQEQLNTDVSYFSWKKIPGSHSLLLLSSMGLQQRVCWMATHVGNVKGLSVCGSSEMGAPVTEGWHLPSRKALPYSWWALLLTPSLMHLHSEPALMVAAVKINKVQSYQNKTEKRLNTDSHGK